MNLKYVLVPLFFFILNPSFAQQSILLEGEILNVKTNELVPFAHLKVLKLNLGTISNAKGKFSLLIPAEYSGEELQISCIGYKTILVKIPFPTTSENQLTILLEEDLRVLGAVTVLSGNPAREIIEKAIDNIQNNYPGREERLNGFFREMLSSDSLFINPYYVAEAVLEVHKKEYSKKAQQGDVKLIKGRKFLGQSYDSLKMRAYAGVHHSHRFDFVMRREGPLNKSNLSKYDFNIQDTLRYENENLIVISFISTKGSRPGGALYIAQNSYAFVKGVFIINEDSQADLLQPFKSLIGKQKRSYLKYITEYSKQDSLWRFKYSEYHTAFDVEKEDKLFLSSTFTTTDYRVEDHGIPYVERIQFHDIVLNETGDYDQDFWKGYNIVSYQPPFLRIREEVEEKWYDEEDFGQTSASRLDKILRIASKVRIAYGLFYVKSAHEPMEITFNHPELGLEERIGQATIHNYGLASHIGYEIAGGWILSFDEMTSFSSRAYNRKALSISWERNLRPAKRPLYLNAGIGIGYARQGLKVNEYHTDQSFFWAEKSSIAI